MPLSKARDSGNELAGASSHGSAEHWFNGFHDGRQLLVVLGALLHQGDSMGLASSVVDLQGEHFC